MNQSQIYQWANIFILLDGQTIVHCPFCGIPSVLRDKDSDWRCSHVHAVIPGQGNGRLVEYRHNVRVVQQVAEPHNLP